MSFFIIKKLVCCHHPDLKKYGVTKTCEQPGVEGATIKYTFFDGDQELCTFDNYYLSAQTHERAFREVGFRCVGFVNPNVYLMCHLWASNSQSQATTTTSLLPLQFRASLPLNRVMHCASHL